MLKGCILWLITVQSLIRLSESFLSCSHHTASKLDYLLNYFLLIKSLFARGGNMTHEITDCTLSPFHRGFYYLMKILFLDSNIVRLQLNLKDSRYKQTERKGWANQGMKMGCDYIFFYCFASFYKSCYSFLLVKEINVIRLEMPDTKQNFK